MMRRPSRSTLFPYTTLFRSVRAPAPVRVSAWADAQSGRAGVRAVLFPAPVLAWAEAQRQPAGERPGRMAGRGGAGGAVSGAGSGLGGGAAAAGGEAAGTDAGTGGGGGAGAAVRRDDLQPPALRAITANSAKIAGRDVIMVSRAQATGSGSVFPVRVHSPLQCYRRGVARRDRPWRAQGRSRPSWL